MRQPLFSVSPPGALLEPYVRRFMCTDFDRADTVEVAATPNGAIYIGWIFAGSTRALVDGQLHADVEAPCVHFAGQILTQDIRVTYSGRYGHLLAECTATGFYELTGIDGAVTVGRAMRLTDFDLPRLEPLCRLETLPVPHAAAGEDRASERLELFRAALEALIPTVRAAPRTLRRGVAMIDENLGMLPIVEIVRKLGVSRQHFDRLFRRIIGIPPKKYASILMVNRAMELLLEDAEASDAQVAVGAGFWDQAHLIRTMRKIVRETPRSLLEHNQTLLPEAVRRLREEASVRLAQSNGKRPTGGDAEV
jgi:AraC-like DNA-binding protein